MDSSRQMGQLLGLVDVIAGEHRPDGVLATALPRLLDLAGAEAAFVLAPTVDGPRVASRAGRELDPGALPECHPDPDAPLAGCPVPESWSEEGIGRVSAHLLPGNAGVLVLAWGSSDAGPVEGLELALTTVDACLARTQSDEKLADLVTRVDNAQQLAHMGDYDWHIPTDTNTWSDQLFRIYGHEPQSFNPSYERFLSLIHPDDRERISALHQRAYATGEAYAMIERIVRPDGEVRFLSSNGEVIFDDTGTPVRMRGTCIDITDRVLADQQRERIAARFQGLVNSAPDAILVLGEQHVVLEANQRAHELLGGDPTGHGIQEFFPGWPDTGTAAVHARGLDGSDLQLDVTTVVVKPTDEGEPDDTLDAVFLRDARSRLEREALAAKLGEAQLRRRQALEINDNVVQGLVAAVYALDQGETATSASYLDRTLAAARAMMDDLLDPLDGEGLQAGDLVRSAPALIGAEKSAGAAEQEPVKAAARTHRVLIVDDAEDLRMLLRARMETRDGLTVVGEAADGVAAVELATELQPDLVMLDLAMPRMDGLEALPLIRDAVPGVRVIVLSGFNQSTLADKAIAAGADRYVVKGGSMRELLDLVDSVLAGQ